MKLRIKARGHNILLLLPTSLLKGRIACNIIQHAVTREVDKRTQAVATNSPTQQQSSRGVASTDIRKLQLQLYKALKRCIKDNGHFNIIDVQTKDGEKVLIRV